MTEIEKMSDLMIDQFVKQRRRNSEIAYIKKAIEDDRVVSIGSRVGGRTTDTEVEFYIVVKKK